MIKHFSHGLIAVLFLAISAIISGAGYAQNVDSSQAPAATTTQQELSELTSKLSTDELNALAKLLELMANDKQAATDIAAKDSPSLIQSVRKIWADYTNYLATNIVALPEVLSAIGAAIVAVFSRETLLDSVLFIGIFLVAMAIGTVADRFVTRSTRNWREQSLQGDTETLLSAIRTLGMRFVLEIAGLLVSSIIAIGILRFAMPSPADYALAAQIILIVIVPVRIVASFLRLTLAPKRPSIRLVSTDDWTAGFVTRNLTMVAAIIGVAVLLLQVMRETGIDGGDHYRFWAGTAIYVYLIAITWRARKGLTSIIKGHDEDLTTGLEFMATWWPAISIAAMVLQYFAAQIALSSGSEGLSPARGISVIAIIVLAPFLDTMWRGIAKHLVPPMQGDGPVAEAAHLMTRQSYVRVGRVVLFAVLILAVFRLWGIKLQNLAAAGVGAKFAAELMSGLIVIVIGYLVWEVINLWINRKLAADMPEGGEAAAAGGEGGGAGKTRLATVLPLLQVTLQITIAIITVLLALSQMGMNITPLLAGAGVFGLAIGFGAQTLVKDVVSGVFFLLDDAFRLGEFIDIGGTMGTVEKISVRSLQLRHPNGPVHIVPYGEIPKLTNNSRDYVIMKLRFTVPFDTDLEKVRKLFKKIGQEMMENPEHAANFIQPFKSQGVADVDDVGIVVRGKFMTKPGAQWMIRKEIYTRVQKAFEENGIQFARKEVRVQIPGLEDNDELTDDQKEEIVKAASTAASDAAEKPADAKAAKPADPF
ncbi:MAG: mechanosensitive ion channel family protein [Rhizobiaceae bacterium]